MIESLSLLTYKLPSKRYLARCTSLYPQVRASLMIMSGFDLPPQKGGAPVALSKRLGEVLANYGKHMLKGPVSLDESGTHFKVTDFEVYKF